MHGVWLSFLHILWTVETSDSAGRFFAANKIKSMLAHVVTTYDVKLEDGATCPQSFRFGTSTSPDPRAKVLFRRRVD